MVSLLMGSYIVVKVAEYAGSQRSKMLAAVII